ncbi:MAG: hypothetical protein L0338_11895, partial [Acidobacteria bacterium]|nr:hypothetical protein [Acidobacteriota bacterium]
LRNTNERRIFAPAFASVANAFSTSGISSYHALQIVGQKRFSKGYTLQVAYSHAKSIDEAGTSEVADNWPLQNPSNRRADRGLGDFDIRNRLVASGLWELPILRGQKTLMGKVLGGWQLAGILNVEDGTPFTVVSGVDRSIQGIGRDRPDLLGDPKLLTDRPKADRLARYFDTSKFALNREGQFGNAGRNILIGPGSAEVDLALQKTFAIMEQKTLHFRWDVFNALNRANFSNPGTSLSSSGSFGKITSAGQGRIMQLSLTFKF